MRTSKCVSRKKDDDDGRSTITDMHNKKIEEFELYYKGLPKKQEEYNKNKKKFDKVTKADKEYLHLRDGLQELEKVIWEMETQENFYKYLSDAAPILLKSSQNVDTIQDKNKYSYNEGITKFISYGGTTTKGVLLNEYIDKTNQGLVDKEHKTVNHTCPYCDSDLMLDHKEAMKSCPDCGHCERFWDMDTPQWSDEVEVITPFSYRRCNHFEDHIKRFQAKESKLIPDEVINKILLRLKRQRIEDPNKITVKLIKRILKDLQLNKFYDNVNNIICILSGKNPPKMDKILEEKLRVMFNTIQIPFDKHKSPDRTNFLSYSYVINKMLRIIGKNEPYVLEFVPWFSLLKSREKLWVQDKIWRGMQYA
jgi:transcription elongation factor Elf1